LYAVLLAGGAYLPLDPAYPVQRLAHMLRDSGASALLFAGELPNELLAGEVDAISLAEHESGAVLDVFPSRATVSSPAYLIYTSGSSGKPKGVAVSHRQLAASTAARREFYRAGPPVFLLLSSLSFDSSVAGIFHCLTTGGSLVITKERAEQDVGRLAALIAERGVTMTLMLPPLYHQLLDFADPWQLRSLRTVIVAGQSCPADLVTRHFEVLPDTELVNEYGPTETTVWATAYRCRPQDAEGEVPIGRPVPGYGILLTDVAGRLCPPGIAGEICIAGAGVADGYWRDRELTAEKFVDLRLPDGSVERVYRSGDLGSWREDGQLLFLGRKDRQVKVRGYRIELEEVRRAVLDLPGVEDAEVITNPEGTLLEAYLQCGRRRAGAGEYRDQLKESLPAHMVPARLIHLDDFPRLPNGKVDRASLRQHAPKPGTEAENRPDPPQTERERILLGIWRELLRAPNIGVTDNFFASGGDSIVSIRLLARARERGLSFPPTAIFDRQTVRELAAVSRTTGSLLAEPSVEAYQGRTPLTPIQQWFFAEHRTAPHHWNQAWLVTADISTDPERLKQAVHTIWKRNEGLRQRFVRTKEGWAGEIYAGTDELSLSRLFHTSTGTVEEQLEQFHREAELSEGGLFRVAMVDPKSSGNTLLFWAHHLVVDAVSWHTLFTDLMRLLGQEEERSPGMRLAYHQWPLFLQRLAREGKHGPELDYWREQTDTALPTDFTVRLPVRESSARTLSGKSSPAATSAFLTDANRAFNTRPEEVLLAATVLALAEWTGSPEHTLMLERHGRDTPGSELAVEETIGWFTRTFPLHFRVPEHQDETEILILVNEQLRAVPNKGIGYGLLRYFTEDSGLDQQPAVYFNYLGQRGEAPDGIAEVRFLRGGMRHPEGERLRMLEINAEVENGQLHIHLTFSEELHREATIRAFLDQLIAALDGLIDRCRSREETTLTPSDFPDSGLGQDELNELFGEIDGL
jgi:amino acid adenylation domain-containing protein/non-ribosomal peptide synthase protein (TIGR01720 family)